MAATLLHALLLAAGAIGPGLAARVRAAGLLSSHSRAAANWSVPKFVVDLDVAPQERWREVVEYYRDEGYLDAMFAPHSPLFREGPQGFVQQEFLEAARPFFDEEFVGEIDGWVKYGNSSHLTRDRVMEFNILYESNYPSFCSGLLAARPDGTVIHGRNLDWELSLEVKGKTIGWAELTTDITMLKNGKPFMNTIIWPAQLLLATAMRFDGWTYEQNTRRAVRDVEANLAAMRQGGQPFGMKARRIMEQVADFDTAVRTLWDTKWAAPHYIIMSGPKPYQGAVLSLDRLGAHLETTPRIRRLDPSHGVWYLLQTNDDWGGQMHGQDFRRDAQVAKLAQASQKEVGMAWMKDEMQSLPLLLKITAFTWIADVANGSFQTLLPPTFDFSKRLGQRQLQRQFAEGDNS